jgi:hypothetical protein
MREPEARWIFQAVAKQAIYADVVEPDACEGQKGRPVKQGCIHNERCGKYLGMGDVVNKRAPARSRQIADKTEIGEQP